MKYKKLFILSVLLVFSAAAVLSAMGGKPVDIPMKISKAKVLDGEYIRMGNYLGGEKTGYTYIVTRIDTNKNRAEIYWQNIDLIRKQNLPDHYTNYNTWHYIFDFQSGRLLYSSYQTAFTNDKGLTHSTFSLDEEKSEAQSDYEYWDGYEKKISHSKIPVQKGYPIVDMNSIVYFPRFLDITGSGLVYLCQPNVLKQTIPFTFTFIGKETVKTPAGEFKTIKASINLEDPFLAKLFAPYERELLIWIEDSPRRLFIKGVYAGGGEVIIEEVSTIREKGME